jgi:hypothetical protein
LIDRFIFFEQLGVTAHQGLPLLKTHGAIDLSISALRRGLIFGEGVLPIERIFLAVSVEDRGARLAVE